MARLRTIKPSFFVNEDLAEIEPLGRLLFAALWCLADRRGRLEDRPRRIKAEALPYDDCDVDTLLGTLTEHGFIERYVVAGRRYVQIVNFERHQSPHIKEAESTIPAPCLHGESMELAEWVVGSGFMGSGDLDPEISAADAAPPAPDTEPDVDYSREVFEEYRVRIQPRAKFLDDARRKIQTRLRRWTADELRIAIDHFAADSWHMENNAHRGAAWFFASDTRIEQYVNMTPRASLPKNGAAKNGHAGFSSDRFSTGVSFAETTP